MGSAPQGVLAFFRLGSPPGFAMGTLGFAGGGRVVVEGAVFSPGSPLARGVCENTAIAKWPVAENAARTKAPSPRRARGILTS